MTRAGWADRQRRRRRRVGPADQLHADQRRHVHERWAVHHRQLRERSLLHERVLGGRDVRRRAVQLPARTASNCALSATNSGSTDRALRQRLHGGLLLLVHQRGVDRGHRHLRPRGAPPATTSNCILTARAAAAPTRARAPPATRAPAPTRAPTGPVRRSPTPARPRLRGRDDQQLRPHATNSGSTDTGTCAAGYTGACSYSCSNGTWTRSPTPAPATARPRPRTATATSAHEQRRHLGDVRQRLRRGELLLLVHQRRRGPRSPTPAPPPLARPRRRTATATSAPRTAAAPRAPAPAASGRGAARYACTNGAWTEVTDTCAPAACTAATESGNCNVSATNSGGTSGTCASGFGAGSCSYACTNGDVDPGRRHLRPRGLLGRRRRTATAT